MSRKKGKRPANWWQKTGEKEWIPSEVERPWFNAASSMSPGDLGRKIKELVALQKKRPSVELNVQIMVFQQVYKQRIDCGPEGREIRVRGTS